MAKARATTFYCKECGYESAKWMGQCPGCHEWNSFVEAPVAVKTKGVTSVNAKDMAPIKLREVDTENEPRYSSGFEEFDRVLGGGIVVGSLVLVGGDPGIGKSTILMQVCHHVAMERKILYISGEESARQIKMRAERVGQMPDQFYLLCETNLARIETVLREEKPQLVVIDSIQTMYSERAESAPGSTSQIRECTNLLMQMAKSLDVTIFVVGHVTKDGTVAGPRMLEHMVDTVLYFEGERSESYRILRAVKNRFGATNEIGVFEMLEQGLKEVLNPSEHLLSGKPENSSGSVVTCLMEGTRPIMVEVQALVTRTNFGLPRRTAVGVDYNRVNMLLAVMEKKLHLHLSEYDVYINIAGGMKISEPALDLAIIEAVISSLKDEPFPEQVVVFGEVGLSGEVRSVTTARARVAEAAKLGFQRCILPNACLKSVDKDSTIELYGVTHVTKLEGV